MAVNDPYTPQQVIKFGLQIIKDTEDLEKVQEEWHEQPRREKLGPFLKPILNAPIVSYAKQEERP